MDLNNFHEHEDVEPGELLEDCWFFGNLLHTKSKSRMLRSFSDPFSSSNFPGNSYEETYESIKKTTTTKEIRSNRKASSKTNSLVRAPSLPTSLASDQDFHDEEEEEREFSMGKLIRQASLNYSDNRPPRKNASKSFTAGSSLTRQKSRQKPEAENVKPPPPATATEEEEVRPQRANKLKAQKSLKDLEIEELRGFKDLGFDFNEKDLSSSAATIIPGLQEKKRVEEEEEYEERRGARPPYVSAACATQRAAPPVPRWGGKRPTEDMKAQIKFWARTVASNVRQEC